MKIMGPGKYKSNQEYISELHTLQEEVVQLKRHLLRMAQAAETHKYAAVIIEHSPAILFRRLAAERLNHRKMAYVSPNISRFGYAAEEFMNNQIMFRHIVHPDDTERVAKEIQSYINRGIEKYKQVYRIITRAGDVRWVEDHTSVVDDPDTGLKYHQGIVVDISKRKAAEEQLHQSEMKYRRIVETTGEGFLLMKKDLSVADVNLAFCHLVKSTRQNIIGKNIFDMVAENSRPFLYANRDDLFHQPNYKFESRLLASDGATIPVLVHGNTLYDDAESVIGNMAFITDMTEQKKALSLAGEVQKSLLPQKAPKISGLDIAGKMIPCDEIGGDYFDFFERSEAQGAPLTVVVGDISGHGVDASLLMATARAFLRMRSSQPGTITDIVNAMNHKLAEDVIGTGKFMTLFYLTIDGHRQCVDWIRAGHEPALLYDPELDRFEELKGAGIALGVDENYRYQSNRKEALKKGQLLIVGTDGIWEGHNKAGEMFGKQRVQEIIRRNASLRAEDILEKIFREQRQFTHDARAEDDLTLVVLKVTQ
jgi:phosphoserine phosphatase RsbU/P